jgi:hypothetical protein
VADEAEALPSASLRWTADGRTVVRKWHFRSTDETTVLAESGCPQRGDALVVGAYTIYCAEVGVVEVPGSADSGGDMLFEVTATYQPLTRNGVTTPVADKASWSVDFRPQTIHVNHVETVADQTAYGPSGSDAESLPTVTTEVNLTDDGPQGVDIDELVEVLTVNFFKDPDDLEDFLEVVRTLRGRVNDDAFIGPWGTYSEGEARLTGVRVSQTAGEVATVTVEFSIREDQSDAGCGGTAPEIYLDSLGTTVSVPKQGHQYLWVQSIKGVDPTDETDVRPRSVRAFVSTFYREGDFSTLGITGGIWS